MVSKVRNVRLGVFSGDGCHHPNIFNKILSLALCSLYVLTLSRVSGGNSGPAFCSVDCNAFFIHPVL